LGYIQEDKIKQHANPLAGSESSMGVTLIRQLTNDGIRKDASSP
jgi:hypothetical protein